MTQPALTHRGADTRAGRVGTHLDAFRSKEIPQPSETNALVGQAVLPGSFACRPPVQAAKAALPPQGDEVAFAGGTA
jgi:hypothetical protein